LIALQFKTIRELIEAAPGLGGLYGRRPTESQGCRKTKGYGILGRPPLPIFRRTVPSIQNERGDIN
jgi:hypothetical protein